eukprot:TRINITY_DN6291_c0_g1_i1.p1 TRINITY_DN6291_c0_g1~~TRINITY_DN6291_c0_g1_i1.p1  ORF type:complete len:277 (-),score=58.37 TRINITY_DN6291_c0_g1_i1:30-860(-)
MEEEQFSLIERSAVVLVRSTPLDGYRTQDSWYYKAEEHKKNHVNTRALGCGLFMLFILALVIIAVMWGSDSTKGGTTTKKKDYNHDMVHVSIPGGVGGCSFARECTKECTTVDIEHQIGCCTGCGLANTCSFPVQVNWNNVEQYELRQRIWLLVSLDGDYWFQSGWGALVSNTSGNATVTNGCFGEAGRPLIMVGCLSDLSLQDKGFLGFPDKQCNSTYGICTASNGILVNNLNPCQPDSTWIGNTYIKKWEGKRFSSSTQLAISVSVFAAAALFL